MSKQEPAARSLENILLESHGAIGPLLPSLLASPVMSVAVIDSQARYQAINGALAVMNGLPIRNHIGKKLRFVLGPAGRTLEDMMHQVIETQKPTANYEFTAKLPGRPAMGRWIGTYLPVADAENRVTRVVTLVAEVTERRNLEQSLSHVVGNLLHVSAALKAEVQFHSATGRWSDERADLLPRSIELIDHCIGHTRNIAEATRRCLSPNKSAVPLGCDETVGVPNFNGNELSEAEGHRPHDVPVLRSLSLRECEVLKLLADCKSNKEIAGQMHISVRTAETYRARIMMKLDLRSIGHLVRYAVRNNIIEA